ncbi:pentapeptide repeat-containing protein [Actinomadura geliboluensis]
MHVPDRAAGPEPAGVAVGAGEVQALEEPGADIGVEGPLEARRDDIAFTGAAFTGAAFTGAALTGAALTGARLAGARGGRHLDSQFWLQLWPE